MISYPDFPYKILAHPLPNYAAYLSLKYNISGHPSLFNAYLINFLSYPYSS